LLYKDEVYDDAIRTGDRMRGYIKTVRPDNKIDVSLQIQGYEYQNMQIKFWMSLGQVADFEIKR
jgi:predicted RNA-binding protein (virulence factor B family)